MKQFLLLATFVVLAFSFTSCGCNQPYTQYPQPVAVQQQPYEYIQGPGGQQMVACYDNSGTRFVLDYLMFTSLMNSGGYGGVTSYYHSYPSRVTIYNNSYSHWNHFSGRSYTAASYRSYRPSASNSMRNPGGPSTFTPKQPASRPSTFTPRTSAPSRSSGSGWSRPSGRSSNFTPSRSSSSSSRRR